jgi:hypothetical protein
MGFWEGDNTQRKGVSSRGVTTTDQSRSLEDKVGDPEINVGAVIHR